MTETQVMELRQQIADVRAWLAEVEAKLDRHETHRAVPAMSVDEQIAEADSATRVYKAMERELGVDRRTILARVERLVRVHGFADPNWGTSVPLAKALATRESDGRFRLQWMLEALDEPVGVGA